MSTSNIDNSFNSDSQFLKLVLFLEGNKVEQELINSYIESGDIIPYLTYHIELLIQYGGWEKFTVDRIEFLYDLKAIYNRIKRQ